MPASIGWKSPAVVRSEKEHFWRHLAPAGVKGSAGAHQAVHEQAAFVLQAQSRMEVQFHPWRPGSATRLLLPMHVAEGQSVYSHNSRAIDKSWYENLQLPI